MTESTRVAIRSLVASTRFVRRWITPLGKSYGVVGSFSTFNRRESHLAADGRRSVLAEALPSFSRGASSGKGTQIHPPHVEARRVICKVHSPSARWHSLQALEHDAVFVPESSSCSRLSKGGSSLPDRISSRSHNEDAHGSHVRLMGVAVEEARALQAMAERVGETFDRAVAMIEGMPPGGRVILTGVGKSGHVARKMAASMSSTGTAAFFVHATEALHGDLGGARKGDVCIAISYSGATVETLVATRGFRRMGCAIIAIASTSSSELGRECDVCLELGRIPELDHNKLAPTASTAAALALGDALMIVISKRSGFSRADFELVHPGGELGKQNRKEMAALASEHMREEMLRDRAKGV